MEDAVMRDVIMRVDNSVKDLKTEVSEMRKAINTLVIVEERLAATLKKTEVNAEQIALLWKAHRDDAVVMANLATSVAVLSEKGNGNNRIIWWMMGMTGVIVTTILSTGFMN